jgi:hypothetical protein
MGYDENMKLILNDRLFAQQYRGLAKVKSDILIENKEFMPMTYANRKPGAIGRIIAHHNSHGLSFELCHDDGTIGHYDCNELVPFAP